MSKKIFLFFILVLFVVIQIFPDDQADTESFISFSLVPGFTIPIGEWETSALNYGGTASLIVNFAVPNLNFLFLEGGAGFSVAPIKLVEGADVDSMTMYTFSPQIGAGVNFMFLPMLGVRAYGRGGYFYSFLDADVVNNTGQNPFFVVGSGIQYMPVRFLGIGVDVSYRNFLGLYNDIVVSIGTSYHFQTAKKIEILGKEYNPYKEFSYEDVNFDPVFPVFFKYYDVNPIGTVKIRNTGKIPMEDVRVKVFISKYMDNPKLCEEIEFLKGGAEKDVSLYALFNENVLSITESTKVSINIVTEATVAGKNYANETVKTIRLYSRNETTWEDDRRAASFVSFKDPTVLRFSKNVLSMVKGKAANAINSNFLAALAFHSALKLYGLSYVIDPSTPYKELSEKKSTVDYLQFPSQTLDYKAGDCDDLSILYCSLLESVGIETAFITVPGHIFLAFSLNMKPSQAKRSFLNRNDLIFLDDKTWCPLEATAINSGFIKAWKTGAKEWRENDEKNLAKLYPVREAWKIYEPVGITGDAVSITLPSQNAVVKSFSDQVNEFLKMELYPRVSELEDELKDSKNKIKVHNSLGVLFAKYGIYDKAKEHFLAILKQEEYIPALINLGNIFFLEKDYRKALSYYERAYKQKPDNSLILLSLAKVNYELSDYNKVKTYYTRLQKDNKDLAAEYSYLDPVAGDDATRAALADESKEDMIWSE